MLPQRKAHGNLRSTIAPNADGCSLFGKCGDERDEIIERRPAPVLENAQKKNLLSQEKNS